MSVFKNKKILSLLKDNWVQIAFWLTTCILLIIEISLLVAWQTTMNEKFEVNDIDGKQFFALTSNAKLQQNVVASIALVFVISLSISIFVTVILAYKKRKIKKG